MQKKYIVLISIFVIYTLLMLVLFGCYTRHADPYTESASFIVISRTLALILATDR